MRMCVCGVMYVRPVVCIVCCVVVCEMYLCVHCMCVMLYSVVCEVQCVHWVWYMRCVL